MTRYTRDEEERVRVQTQLRMWARSGLISAVQAAALDADLKTDLRRTNTFLRAVLALFTCVVVQASVGLVFLSLEIRSEQAAAVTTACAGIVCLVAANNLVASLRLYRYGVEEALAASAVVLVSVSAGLTTGAVHGWGAHNAPVTVALSVGAVAAFAIYRLFGFVYAAVGAMVSVAAIPFQLELSRPLQRVAAAAALAAMFAVSRALHRRHGDDYPGDDYNVLEAAAWLGLYMTLNLHLLSIVGAPFMRGAIDPRFYWTTYAAIWILPVAGLALGIREKDRLLTDVSLLIALATLATNKPYLGVPRQAWDPALLGLLLIAVALGVRRWLSAGPDGERAGFTAARLLQSERDAIRMLGTVSAGVQAPARAPAADESTPMFSGGRSGGAGGGTGY